MNAHERVEASFGRRLALTAKTLRAAFERAMADAGGSLTTWIVLQELAAGEGMNQRTLAACVDLSGATLTHHLDRMEADGLLERRRDPSDRRVVRLHLRPAGRDLHDRLGGVSVAFDQHLTAGCDPDDLAATHRVLARLRANLAPGRLALPPEPVDTHTDGGA